MFELVKSGNAGCDDCDTTRATLARWQQDFIQALRELPSVSHACKAARVSRQTAYRHRTENKVFAAAWLDSLHHSVDLLEAQAFKLALAGDANLIQFMLRCHRPSVYRDTQRMEIDARHIGVILLPEKESKAP